MVPLQYPPQQKKADGVVALANQLAASKAKQENMAAQLAEQAQEPGLYRLLKAIEKSVRLVNEDLLREAGTCCPKVPTRTGCCRAG